MVIVVTDVTQGGAGLRVGLKRAEMAVFGLISNSYLAIKAIAI